MHIIPWPFAKPKELKLTRVSIMLVNSGESALLLCSLDTAQKIVYAT